jgi:hypothetical protein
MKCLKEWLEIAANIAAIVTGIVAFWAWWCLKRDFSNKQKLLESYLKDEKEKAKKAGKQGEHSAARITKETGLSESEILRASYNNPRIGRVVPKDERLAQQVLFYYNDKPLN